MCQGVKNIFKNSKKNFLWDFLTLLHFLHIYGKCSKANFDAILRRSKAYATQGESDKANSKAILGQSEAIKAHNKSDNKSSKSKHQQIKQIKQIKRRTPAASIREGTFAK